MKTRADRLSRLVDNVLLFARLERINAKSVHETTRLADAMDRRLPRLTERVADELNSPCKSIHVIGDL